MASPRFPTGRIKARWLADKAATLSAHFGLEDGLKVSDIMAQSLVRLAIDGQDFNDLVQKADACLHALGIADVGVSTPVSQTEANAAPLLPVVTVRSMRAADSSRQPKAPKSSGASVTKASAAPRPHVMADRTSPVVDGSSAPITAEHGGSNEGRETGIMVRWNDEKGFGFVKPDCGGGDVFCHWKSLLDGMKPVPQGARVRYVRTRDERAGKDRAEEVSILHGDGGHSHHESLGSESPGMIGGDHNQQGAPVAPLDHEGGESWSESRSGCRRVDLAQMYRKRWRFGVELSYDGKILRRY